MVRLIGFDSMGTRGMCTVIDTGSVKIIIDPGVSLAPRRFGLPPHPVEEDALRNALDEIHGESLDADYFVISHYHKDHYLYRDGEEQYYLGKTVFAKNPYKAINRSQRIRAYVLLQKMRVKDLAREIIYCDGGSYTIDDGVKLNFSIPVPHGPDNTMLGYVVMTLVDVDGYRILHASDVQGPISSLPLDFIVSSKPDLLIISGPPTYFEEFKMDRSLILRGLGNLRLIVENLRSDSTVVVDHHLLRDLNYYDRIKDIISIGREHGIRVITAAEYMGLEPRLLEAHRRELWGGGAG